MHTLEVIFAYKNYADQICIGQLESYGFEPPIKCVGFKHRTG